MKEIPTPAGALSTFLAQPVSRVYQWLILWLRRHTTIRFRIYLFAGVMLLMFYSVTLYLFVAYVADIKSERMMSLHFVVSDLLTSAAGQALRRGDKDHIVPLVNTLVDTTEISRIAVVDSTGDVFVERTDTRKASSDIETFSVPVIWRGVDVNATAFLDPDAISVNGRRFDADIFQILWHLAELVATELFQYWQQSFGLVLRRLNHRYLIGRKHCDARIVRETSANPIDGIMTVRKRVVHDLAVRLHA